MIERPVYLRDHEVRAVLAGQQTQFRRLVKARGWNPNGPDYTGRAEIGISPDPRISLQAYFEHRERVLGWHGVRCPFFGQAGDRLWVREAWVVDGHHDSLRPGHLPPSMSVRYPADGSLRPGVCEADGKVRSGISMPRWASRITLAVTGVSIERLQDISEADALAEGIVPWRSSESEPPHFMLLPGDTTGAFGGPGAWRPKDTPQLAFQALWDRLHRNGSGSWDENPWVWVISFKPVEVRSWQ